MRKVWLFFQQRFNRSPPAVYGTFLRLEVAPCHANVGVVEEVAQGGRVLAGAVTPAECRGCVAKCVCSDLAGIQPSGGKTPFHNAVEHRDADRPVCRQWLFELGQPMSLVAYGLEDVLIWLDSVDTFGDGEQVKNGIPGREGKFICAWMFVLVYPGVVNAMILIIYPEVLPA